jgi:parallel beta-helix repeat protein
MDSTEGSTMNRVFFLSGVRRLIAPFAVVAALVALAEVGTVQARPVGSTVSCGDTLKASVKLTTDLLDCSGSGLIVGADNITVDLNGHTIGGMNKPTPGTGGVVIDKHANVKVVNGTITGFHFGGVGVTNTRGAVLSKLTVRKIGAGCKHGDICAGIFLMNATGTKITDSAVSSQAPAFQANGIDVDGSPDTLIQGTRVDRNAGAGISVFGSPRSRFVGNELAGNKEEGLQVNSSSDSTLVSGNRAKANGTAGIAAGASSKLSVVGNTVSGNGQVGLLLFDPTGALVRGNHANGNPFGIVLYGGQAGVAQYGGKTGAVHNQLIGNSTTGNSTGGILVRGDGGKDVADDNLLSGNFANSNGRDGGIVIQGSATGNTLRGNTANANKGQGIVAPRGTIDAGGNRGRGNKRSPQCVGVRCS